MKKSVKFSIDNKEIATKNISEEVPKIEKTSLKGTLYFKRKGKYYFKTLFGIIIISEFPFLSQLKHGDVITFDY